MRRTSSAALPLISRQDRRTVAARAVLFALSGIGDMTKHFFIRLAGCPKGTTIAAATALEAKKICARVWSCNIADLTAVRVK